MTKLVKLALVSLILSLLGIGVASGTVVRHIVQVIPAAVLLVALMVRRPWGALGALPVFALWAILMVMVWLTVSAIWNVAPGRYTPVEVMLSVVIGLACLFGIVASVRLGYRPGWIRFGIFALWAIIQVCAMVVSFTRPIARDASFRAVFGL